MVKRKILFYHFAFYPLLTHKTILMDSKNLWLRIAGTIFGVVAIFHLLRILTTVPVLVDGWLIPVWFNWIGLVATGFLCIWLWWISGSGK